MKNEPCEKLKLTFQNKGGITRPFINIKVLKGTLSEDKKKEIIIPRRNRHKEVKKL
jgi:hypothetical protein